jgi:hypothetical protein
VPRGVDTLNPRDDGDLKVQCTNRPDAAVSSNTAEKDSALRSRGLECGKAASVDGLFHFAGPERSGPSSGGLGAELRPPFQPLATRKQAANGQLNYRNPVDRSELVWSTSVGGLFHIRPSRAICPLAPLATNADKNSCRPCLLRKHFRRQRVSAIASAKIRRPDPSWRR